MRILLVEDERNAAQLLSKGLEEHSFAVDIASDGGQALELAGLNDYDLIVLDVMLPVVDGLAVCRQLRSEGSKTPILMLTARDAVEQRVAGLDCGADDYLTKPFDFRELLARIRALIRRGPALTPQVLRVADLSVDTGARIVRRGTQLVDLTAKEYALLEFLARRSGQIVPRDDIAEHVWDQHADPLSNLIEVYIRRLRKKVDAAHPVKLIQTKRGLGYLLAPSGAGDA